MAVNILNNLDLNLNQLLNTVAENVVTSDPATGLVEGRLIYRSDTNVLKFYDGSTWQTLGTSSGLSNSLASGHIFVGDGSNVAADVAPSGDISAISTAGAFTIANLAVTAAKIANTTITAGKLDTTSVTLSSIGAPTADVGWGGFKITNVADPTAANHAATKNYVDNSIVGLNALQAVKAATTTNGALATAYENGDTLDGYTLATGDRILIKDQSAPAENGIYTVNATGAPTRATDFDAWSEVPNAYVWVEQGTVNGDSGWVSTSAETGTLDTTAITWTLFTASTSLIAGNGLVKNGNVIDVNVDNSTIELNADALRVKDLGITNAKIATGTIDLAAKVTGLLPIANGGTNASSAATARQNLAAAETFSADCAAATTTTVTHNLNTKDVHVAVRDTATDALVFPDIKANNVNSVDVTFAAAPSAGAYRITVVGYKH